jgi:hypothetical protein
MYALIIWHATILKSIIIVNRPFVKYVLLFSILSNFNPKVAGTILTVDNDYLKKYKSTLSILSFKILIWSDLPITYINWKSSLSI